MTQEELEDLYGPRASHSEHKVGDRIRYKHDGQATSGKIISVCAPVPAWDMRLCYVVLNDERGYPDFAFPADVLSS